MDYGNIIKSRRKLIGVTQEELADVAQISLSYVKLIEQGKANPSINVLVQILDAMGMEIQLVEKKPEIETDHV